MESDSSSQECLVIGWKTIDTSPWEIMIKGKKNPLWGWSNTRTSYLGKLWNTYHQRCLRHNKKGPWATWSCSTALSWSLDLMTSADPFQTKLFYDSITEYIIQLCSSFAHSKSNKPFNTKISEIIEGEKLPVICNFMVQILFI